MSSERPTSEGLQKNYLRLPVRDQTPAAADIRGLLAEAERLYGRLVEQPWTVVQGKETFSLTVKYELGSDKPIWTLYQGGGSDSKVVWGCTDRDLELIFDIVSMIVEAAERALLPPPPKAEPAAGTASEPGQPGEVQPEKGYFETLTPVDFDLLKKQSNVLLGHLLIEAGLLTGPILETALKLQDMVRTDTLTPLQAIEALRRAHARESPAAHATAKAKASPMEEYKATKRETQKQGFLVVDVIKKAGLLSEEDFQAGLAVMKKTGGEIDKILLAAGKVDAVTLEAAATCWELMRDGLMKAEQTMIALHYCHRSRVSFDEAISELGWEKPHR